MIILRTFTGITDCRDPGYVIYKTDKEMMTMRFLAGLSRTGDKFIRIILEIIMVIFFLLGGYILWHTWMVYHSAFDLSGVEQYKPELAEEGMSLEEIRKINPDVIGWISIDGTHIDYPLLQGRDNQEYLNKDINGDFALHGSIYLDSLNNRDFSDSYNIIYGHHMDNGGMFGDIVKFKDEKYFESHESGNLWLKNKTYKLEICAIMMEDAYDREFTGPKGKDSDITDFMKTVYSRAIYSRPVEVSSADRLAGLLTCDSAFTNGRNILVCKLVPEKDDDTVHILK